MPSHFTHLIFTEEAVSSALGEAGARMIANHGNILRFAAQGPDFFYHNQRTVPTGLRYGVLLHRHRFGTFVEKMAREAVRLGAGPASELAAFIIGFATHAPLDRRTHPYIGYFAGWVDPDRPETNRYFHCHPFLERVLDVLVLRERRGKALSEFEFFPLVRCGKSLPYQVVKTIVKGLNATYPSMSYKSRDRKRVENAYHDAMFFYKLTNHRNPALYSLAIKKDSTDNFRKRRIALLHPPEIPPGLDFLNKGHAAWCHPCDESHSSSAGFMEIYEQALVDAREIVSAVSATIAGAAPLGELAAKIGEQSLDMGREPCTPRYSNPLPLSEIMEGIYARKASEPGGR